MTRIQEIKSLGYTLRLYSPAGNKDFQNVRYYIIIGDIMTLYGIDGIIITDVNIKNYSGFSLITKNL